MALTPEAWAKCDAELRRALERLPAASQEELPVMIVFAPSSEPPPPPPGPERSERLRWARERERRFAARTRDLVAALAAAGARELTTYWVGDAIGGRLPARAIDLAGKRPEVVRLELIVRRQAAL